MGEKAPLKDIRRKSLILIWMNTAAENSIIGFLENLSELAPKSFNGYRRMKNSKKQKNYKR